MYSVVIQGSGRSGTSILGELFEHIPGYHYLFEPQIEELKNAIDTSDNIVACKVPKGGNQLSPGLASAMDAISKIMPDDTKYIWIARNPLDAVCSLKPGIEAEWSHNPKPPNYLELLDEPWHIKCAHHWNHINDIGLKTLKEYGDVHIIRYRDLLDTPEEEVKKILDFIEVDVSLDQLNGYFSKISNKVDGSYHAKNQVLWFRNDHSTRKDRYKENLTQEQINEVIKITGETAQSLGFYTE